VFPGANANGVTHAADVPQEIAAVLVRSCYREVAGDEPDDATLRDRARRLAEDVRAAFPRMLHDVYGSASARRLRAEQTLRAIGESFMRARGASVRACVGAGLGAYTPWLLRVAGIARNESPFDRVRCTPRMLAHVLDDDFETLLRTDDYEPVAAHANAPDGARAWDHVWYRERFGHARIVARGDADGHDADAELRSAVERFRATARSVPATYVTVAPDALLWEAGFEHVSRALRAYAPFTRLVYVVVRACGTPLPVLVRAHEDDGHVLYELRATSTWHPRGFENVLDDVELLTAVLERL